MTTNRSKRRPRKSTDVAHGDIRVFEPRIPPAVKKLIAGKRTLRLDVGCGANKNAPDCIGMDKRALPGVDIVHDLETFPWPLPSNSVRVVFMSHFLEHVKPWLFFDLFGEIHRVMQHDGQVLISGPYGVEFRFVQDPTHILPINEATLAYLDKLHPSGLWHVYEPPVFHLEVFDVLPAGRSRDFNAILRVCKDGECKHAVAPMTAPPAGV